MGFKQVDLVPLGQASSITPASKDVRVKAFIVGPSVTTQTTFAWLPANSSIVDVSAVVKVAGSDSTNASISVGANGTTNNIINAQTITAATVARGSLPTVIADPEGNQPGSDIRITAQVGGATTTLAQTTVLVYYVM